MIMMRPAGVLLKRLMPISFVEAQEVIKNWHKGTLPKHFKNKAFSDYGYKKRTKSYQKYKDKKHLGPLVFSGKSRDILKAAIRLGGTPKKVTGAMSAPRYFWMKPANQPNKPLEIVTTTKKEREDMAEELKRRVTKRLNYIEPEPMVI
jgi:hypothetical protein